jgi:hypothetical protein
MGMCKNYLPASIIGIARKPAVERRFRPALPIELIFDNQPTVEKNRLQLANREIIARQWNPIATKSRKYGAHRRIKQLKTEH